MSKPPATPPVTATTLQRLLDARFATDHYTTAEIKGPNGNGRLDFVAIKASWSQPDVHGCEIKVSRSDFLHDNKWPEYLDACHQFWFVTKAGICTKGEIPEQAGWLEASTNGAKLFTRKKAPRREMEYRAQAKLFRQILHRQHFKPWEMPELTRREAYAKFLAAKAEDADLGSRLGKAVQAHVREWKTKVAETERAIAGYAAIAKFLEAKGISVAQISFCAEKESRWGCGAAESLIRHHCPELLNDIPAEIAQLETAARILEEATRNISGQIRRAHASLKNTCGQA